MGTKPRVLLLGKLPPPYIGPAIATDIIINSSINRHFQLAFHSVKLNLNLDDLNKVNLIKIIRLVKNYFDFKIKTIKESPDIILIPIGQTAISFYRDSIYVCLINKKKCKCLLQLRGSNFRNWYHASNWIVKKIIRYILNKSDGVIVLGDNLRDIFKELIDDSKIFVVSNGANFKFPSKKREASRFRILYISNLQPQKGIEDVIDAVEILLKNGSDVECNVIGQWRDNSTKLKCMEKVSQNNLPIIFHGVKTGEEKAKYFSEADIFVFPPSQPEGHPWVLIEAMAAGLPIISTDTGAIRESVIDGYNGFLVEKNSPTQISKRIEMLMNDTFLRDRMSEASYSHYKEHFTEEKMVARLKDVFEKVISNTLVDGN